MKRGLVSLVVMMLSLTVFCQKKILNLPDIPGYVTLKCDFHTHTVFSDGSVWPTTRIDEAIRDGLDAIAITDHLEYTPKKEFLPVDHNAGWKIGEQYARERNFILVHGTEITRKMPPGHFNALFITDANLIARDSVWDSFREAVKQGAFIQWNHPGWKAQQPDGIPRIYDVHRKLIASGWLHGIEFFNEWEYYPLVFRFCKENKLTLTCNSDIHDIISETYHFTRPMTLVFAKEKSLASLKEAMFAGRTLAYFENTLAGWEQFARPFFEKCISVGKPFYQDEKNVYFEVTNSSDITFYLVNGKQGTPSSLVFPSNSVTRVIVSNNSVSPLTYDVKNILTGEDETLRIELAF